MTINIHNDVDKYSLNIEGELTIYTTNEYKNYLVENFFADKTLEINLENIEEIDSCGLQLLATMCKQLLTSGNEMKIITASDVAKDALEVSRLMTDMKFIIESKHHES